MNRRHVATFICALVMGGCMNKQAATSPLAGVWAPDSATLGGAPLPIASFNGAKLHLTDSTYEFAGDTGVYVLPASATPATMDITGRVGPNAGRTIPAIYELSGTTLTVGYQLDKAGARPTDFTSPKGTQVLVVRYQRVP